MSALPVLKHTAPPPDDVPLTELRKCPEGGGWSVAECDRLIYKLGYPRMVIDPADIRRLVIIGEFPKPLVAKGAGLNGDLFEHQVLRRLDSRDPVFPILRTFLAERCPAYRNIG